eukprot:3938542-Rhodomonas_salina.3
MFVKYSKWLDPPDPKEKQDITHLSPEESTKCQVNIEESSKWESKLNAFTERARLAFLAGDAVRDLLTEWDVVVSSYSDLDLSPEDTANEEIADDTVARMQEAMEKVLQGSGVLSTLQREASKASLDRQASQDSMTSDPESPLAADRGIGVSTVQPAVVI